MASLTPNIEAIKRRMAKKQNTINKNAQKRKRIHPKNLFVGWTDKSGRYSEQAKTERVTTNHRDGSTSSKMMSIKVKEVARIHELGLGNHPEKGMIRITSKANRKRWMKFYKQKVLPALMKGDKSKLWMELSKLGSIIKMDLKTTVLDIDLVDTGRLANSILVEYKGR